MIRLIALLLFLPSWSFTQQENPSYTLNSLGLTFMILTWTAIITWNIICFSKILSQKED